MRSRKNAPESQEDKEQHPGKDESTQDAKDETYAAFPAVEGTTA
jgi:hypothetical protein